MIIEKINHQSEFVHYPFYYSCFILINKNTKQTSFLIQINISSTYRMKIMTMIANRMKNKKWRFLCSPCLVVLIGLVILGTPLVSMNQLMTRMIRTLGVVLTMMSFLSSCLEHDDNKLLHTLDSDVGMYGHFPTMLLNFAYESRVDSGYRLLDRCARHACDPRTRPLNDTNAKLFKHNGKFVHYLF
jgi:hypothetical protein